MAAMTGEPGARDSFSSTPSRLGLLFEHDLRANVVSFVERETGFRFSGSCA
jgi:hypothetical protein